MALEVKEVIQVAKRQFVELLPDLALAPLPAFPAKEKATPGANALAGLALDSSTTAIRLEELERDGSNWAVTLSAPNPDFKESDLLDGIRRARSLARVAKVIVIDGETGNLIALRERAA